MTAASTSSPHKTACVLDQSIVNSKTIGSMEDLGISFFASLCGRNRGAFVLDPSDGNTWGCTSFPPNFASLATGQEDMEDLVLKDANAIKETFVGGNVTAAETVQFLDYFVKMVFHSSPNVDQDPYACNTGGLTRLQCDPVHTIATIRSVTLAGLLTGPEGGTPWVFSKTKSDSKTKKWTLQDAQEFYTSKDFQQMRDLGLNTVQIPVPVTVFEDTDTGTTSNEDVQDYLAKTLLPQIQDAGLQAILQLQGQDNDDSVAAAAHFAALHSSVVFGLTVPSRNSLRAARAAETSLKILVPVTQGDLAFLDFPDTNTFGALDLGHTTSVGDVASSTSADDRSKLFYHENTACIARSPLEYAQCYKRVPLLVSSGFDLAIDNCVWKDTADSNHNVQFVDYGQCDRFDETIDSPWWHTHRQSFAARQLASYEQGLGWSFAAWKLHSKEEDVGVLDTPSKLLSFRDVAAAGLVPSLTKSRDNKHIVQACLNPPTADFILGDDTLAPTAGPPPDCGNGWWNASINNCTYWVPPPEPAPELTTNVTAACADAAVSSVSSLQAGGVGLVVGLVAAWVGTKVLGGGRRQGYSEIPH